MSGETYVEIHDGAWGNFKGWATIDSARVGGYDWAEPEFDWDNDRQTAAAELRSRLAQSRPRKRIAHDVRKGFQR